MDMDFDLSRREEELYQPQLSACLQDFTKTAEEIGHKSPRFIGVLNTMPDEHIDGYYPRKRIRLALVGKESPGESRFLRSSGSDAAELTDPSASIDFHCKGMGSMNGPSNDALCYVTKATGLGSPKPINLWIEEQDYIGSINLVQDYLDKINNIVKSGGSQDVLKAALSAMEQVTDMLTSYLEKCIYCWRKKKKGHQTVLCINQIADSSNDQQS